jgi:type I restriction enzyme S subunit
MFYRESDFQDTPAGEIPKDWEAKRVKDVATDLVGGGTPSTTCKDYWNGNIAWMTSAHINGMIVTKGQKYITRQGLENSATNIVPKENLLVATRVGIGKVAVNKIDIAISQDLTGVIVDKNRADPNFLYWVLFNNSQKLKSLAQGSTIKGVLRDDLGKLRLPMPSKLSEQRGIVEVLGVVDSAIELADKVIAKTGRLKKGLMQQLLTRGIGHTEYKDTPIGKTPKEWNFTELRDLISDVKTGFASGKRDEKGIVQVRMNNLTTDGRLLLDSYLKVPTPENINGWLLKPNDFLFNNTNSIDLVGKSAIFKGAPFPCTFSNHFTRIKFKENLVLPEVILYHFITQWEKGYFKSVAIRHVGQAAVHTEYLLRLQIPLPPISEQKKIVEIISITNRKLELERHEKVKLEKIKLGLMDLLLTGKVRIKVD